MRILYVTTISNTVNAFLIPHIEMLINEGHQVDVAFNLEQEVNPRIKELGCKVWILPFQRSPLKLDNKKAYKQLKELLVREKYDLVHTHTPIASAIVRLVCKKLVGIKVFYTAHGFHFYTGAPLVNWLAYYPVEKYLSRYTDTLLTINKEDYERAKTKFKAKNIEYVPGVGLDLEKFAPLEIDKAVTRERLALPEDAFLVLSVGELNKNKNHEIVIRAIAKLNNPKVHYVICGQGQLEDYLKNLSKELSVENQVHLLGFRKDISTIMQSVDMFAFPSFREGLSVALMESMANGLPVVCSKIRGNVDLIEDEEGGYLVGANDFEIWSKCIEKLLKSQEKRKEMGLNNRRKVDGYERTKVLYIMNNLYKM